MVKSGVKLMDIVDDVKDIIVCGVENGQMQSSYLFMNGEVHFCTMCISNYPGLYYTHENSISIVRDFIDNRKEERFNVFDLEYLNELDYYSDVIKAMEYYQEKFNRINKIDQLIK